MADSPAHPAMPPRAQTMPAAASSHELDATMDADTSLPVEIERHFNTISPAQQEAMRKIAATNDISAIDWPELKEAMKLRIDGESLGLPRCARLTKAQNTWRPSKPSNQVFTTRP
jgi:hypothetical protein